MNSDEYSVEQGMIITVNEDEFVAPPLPVSSDSIDVPEPRKARAKKSDKWAAMEPVSLDVIKAQLLQTAITVNKENLQQLTQLANGPVGHPGVKTFNRRVRQYVEHVQQAESLWAGIEKSHTFLQGEKTPAWRKSVSTRDKRTFAHKYFESLSDQELHDHALIYMSAHEYAALSRADAIDKLVAIRATNAA